MKNAKLMVVFCMLALMPCAALGENVQDMMGQYQQMSAGTSKNFPKEMEVLMPKGFTTESKGFVCKETMNMFLYLSLSGSRKNDVYKNFRHDATIEIGIMAYNPQMAPYMAAQMPVILDESKKGFSKGITGDSADWEYGPVVASKINNADVYIQKGTLKNVEIDDRKHEDQSYYFGDAIMINKNAMLKIRIIYYPLKSENVTEAINEVTKVFLATDFGKYMK